jgi:hypothetical protein
MRRLPGITCAVWALVTIQMPAFGETSVERGKRIVMDSIAALGGEKFLTVRDRIESGRAYSFYREELQGLSIAKVYTRYLDHPAPGELGVREREVFGKKEDDAVLFMPDGSGWEVTFRGARPLTADRVARYKESTMRNVFYIFRERLHEPGLIFDSQGSDVWDNMPVDIVDLTDSDNRTTTVYFHKSTKLPVRQLFYRRDPKTKERDEEVTVFSKYRDVGDGVQWPFDVRRERNGEKIFEMFSESVSINKDVPDEYFNLPSGIKKLKPVALTAPASPDSDRLRAAAQSPRIAPAAHSLR